MELLEVKGDVMDIINKDPICKLLPEKGWLRDYVIYSSGGWPPVREMPPRFNFFVGLVILGSVLRRRVYFEKENRLFPNLYIMLVSPPGVGKKTTAITYGEDLLMFLKTNKPRILPSKITPEDFLRFLALKQELIVGDKVEISSSGLFMCSELSVLMGKQQYLVGLPQILTDLYDCPEIKEISTIKHGKWVLKNVFISLVGGTTTESLQSSFPKEALEQGLLSRFIIINMPEDWDLRNPKPPRKDYQQREKLALELEKISKIEGEVKWASDAEKLYDQWYMERTISKDIGYFEREPDHVIKLATLFEISSTGQRVISLDTLSLTIKVANIIAEDVMTYLPALKAEIPNIRAAKVLRKLVELGGLNKHINHSKLLLKCWHFLPGRGAEFNEITQLLEELRVIDGKVVEGKKLYKAKTANLWIKTQVVKEEEE